MKSYRLLIINPGSTSTKIAIFENENPILVETLRHQADELAQYKTIFDQYSFREDAILKILKQKNVNLKDLDAIIGRGGMLKPIEGGTYAVNDLMLKDLKIGYQGQHASNLGGILAYEIASEFGIPSFIVDPVVVDELQDVARISGMPEINRRSIFHPLNQKAVARRYAALKGVKYEDLNVIVAHLGGGISVGAHTGGRVIDVNNAFDGEGPFSPERTGTLPVGDLIRLCYSGKYTLDEMLKKNVGRGGFVAYLGTNDTREVERRIDAGDKKAELVFNAMAYQVAKEIGGIAAVLSGKVDAILLTGGVAYSKRFTDEVTRRVEFIAPVTVFPGEDEMLALAEGGLRVLRGEEKAKAYK